MIGYGGVYPVAFDVYGDTGVLADATTVTLTITLPDGSTVTPTVTSPPAVTGKYRYAYQTTMAGRHTLHAVTSGPVTVYDEEFDVGETPSLAIVSLADAKAQLNMDDPADTSDDDELRAFIAGVTGAVEQYLHETVVRRAVTDEIELCGQPRFRLWSAPVISLTSVTSWDGSQTWDVTQMRVSGSGMVRILAGPRIWGLVDVTYLAGYQVIPENYRRGALVVLQHVWETQRGAGTFTAGVIGAEERVRQPGEWFTIPAKAKEFFGPPRPVVA